MRIFRDVGRKAPLLRIAVLSAVMVIARFNTALADPMLPTIASTVYDVTVSNNNIDSGAAAVADGTTDNKAVINAFISYVSSHGGGTVELPAALKPYESNNLTIRSNVNLQVDTGAVLQNLTPANSFITNSGTTSNIEISGGGIIDDNASAAGGNNMIQVTHNTNLAVTGVTIENASHEHLVLETDTNVTVNGITIKDPLGLLSNADGIDYSGSNFLIENSNIADGDDDIVAKPSSVLTTNVLITKDTIGAGHGISIGGGFAAGMTNTTVSHITFSGTGTGLRIKAQDLAGGDAGGGFLHPVSGITYSDITMTGVADPIVIDSFYNGNSNFPTGHTDPVAYPSQIDITNDINAPVIENILFQNITATGATQAGSIFGLDGVPASLSGLVFDNVNITASSQMQIYYAANVDYSGLTVNVPSNNAFAHASPVKGVDMFAVTVPEPATLAMGLLGVCGVTLRRGRAMR